MMMEEAHFYGDPASASLFLQMTDRSDSERMEEETEALKKLSGRSDWCIVSVPVKDWNQDLTPWEAGPVFGDRGFGSGAGKTLKTLTEKLIPEISAAYPNPERKVMLCGYSLAGLFALWGGYRSELFSGVAAVSPSVWYPRWIEWAKTEKIRTGCVYLSLGDCEEKTRNRVMASVGDCIREQHRILLESGVSCVLEWNPGNHFVESGVRTARGMAWLLKHI